MGEHATWRTCCPARLAPSLTVRVCGPPGSTRAARMGDEWVRSRPSSAATRNPDVLLVYGLAGTRCRMACSSSPHRVCPPLHEREAIPSRTTVPPHGGTRRLTCKNMRRLTGEPGGS